MRYARKTVRILPNYFQRGWETLCLSLMSFVCDQGSYFISRKFGDFLRVKLEARGVKIPRLPPYEQYEFVFLMRMIPGNPLAVQNYALGLAGIPFVKYVVVSLPIQYVQIFGYVYLGEGFFTGGFSNMAIAVSFFVILAIVARMLDKRYGHKLRGKNGISKTER